MMLQYRSFCKKVEQILCKFLKLIPSNVKEQGIKFCDRQPPTLPSSSRRIDLGILGTWPSTVSWDVEREAQEGGLAVVFLFGLKHFYFECLSLKYTPAIYVCVCLYLCAYARFRRIVTNTRTQAQTWQRRVAHLMASFTITAAKRRRLRQRCRRRRCSSCGQCLWLVSCLLCACVGVCVHLFLLSVCATSHNYIYKQRGRGEQRRNSSSNAQLMSLGFIVRVVFAQIALPFRLCPVQCTPANIHCPNSWGNSWQLCRLKPFICLSLSLSLSFSLALHATSAVNNCGCQYFIFDWLLLVM